MAKGGFSGSEIEEFGKLTFKYRDQIDKFFK